MTKIADNSFKFPVLGIDPITKGTFTIEWAYIHFRLFEDEKDFYKLRATGKITLNNLNENPLYKIAKNSPLRLQGLVASVDFGAEKRFIRIEVIKGYYPEVNGVEQLALNPVTFEILDNLDYLEAVQTYRDDNLI